MLRYIDADALKNRLEGWPSEFFDYDELIPLIDEQPTISPDELRGVGKWAHLGGDEWCCSECGHVITTEGSWEHPLEVGAKHCENCGAKMEVSEDA